MSLSATNAPRDVEGDVIWWPIWHAWLMVAFSVFCAVVGLATVGLPVWMVLRPGPSPPSLGLILIFGGMGLFILIAGVFLFRFGWWQIRDRPRWVIGPDCLQFMDGVSRVRVYIPYTNLAAVEICKPRMGVAPFIGLRLVHPELFKIYAGFAHLRARKIHQHFGYDWCIAEAESDVPLRAVLEMVQGRFQQWQAAAASPASAPVPNPVTEITPSPPAQQNFTKNHP